MCFFFVKKKRKNARTEAQARAAGAQGHPDAEGQGRLQPQGHHQLPDRGVRGGGGQGQSPEAREDGTQTWRDLWHPQEELQVTKQNKK